MTQKSHLQSVPTSSVPKTPKMEKQPAEKKPTSSVRTRSRARGAQGDPEDPRSRSQSGGRSRSTETRTPAKSSSKSHSTKSRKYVDYSSSEEFVDRVDKRRSTQAGNSGSRETRRVRKPNSKYSQNTYLLELDDSLEGFSQQSNKSNKSVKSTPGRGYYLPVCKVMSTAGSKTDPDGVALGTPSTGLEKTAAAGQASSPPADVADAGAKDELTEHEEFFNSQAKQGDTPSSPQGTIEQAAEELSRSLGSNSAVVGSPGVVDPLSDGDATIHSDSSNVQNSGDEGSGTRSPNEADVTNTTLTEESVAAANAKADKPLVDIGILTQSANNLVSDLSPQVNRLVNYEIGSSPSLGDETDHYRQICENYPNIHHFHNSSSSQASFDPDRDLPPPEFYEALDRENEDNHREALKNKLKWSDQPTNNINFLTNEQKLLLQAGGSGAGANGAASTTTLHLSSHPPPAANVVVAKGAYKSLLGDEGEEEELDYEVTETEGDDEEEDMDATSTFRPKRTRQQALLKSSSDTDTDPASQAASSELRPKIKPKAKTSKTSPDTTPPPKPLDTSTPTTTRPPTPTSEKPPVKPVPSASDSKGEVPEPPPAAAAPDAKDAKDKAGDHKPAPSPGETKEEDGKKKKTRTPVQAPKSDEKPKKPQRLPQPPGLVRLPEVPRERDTRFQGCGYVYVSQEQWKEDKDFVRFQLKLARSKIAQKIFDTEHETTQTSALKRFWASTGVSKTKPLNEVIADLVNSREGWIDLYNKWEDMDAEANPQKSADTHLLLQELAITISRTPAFKKSLHAKKKEEDEKKKKREDKDSKNPQPSTSAQPAAPSSAKTSNKDARFNKLARNDDTSAGANGAATGAKPKTTPPAANPPSSASGGGQQKKPNLKPPAGRTPSTERKKNVSFDDGQPDQKSIPSLMSLQVKTPPRIGASGTEDGANKESEPEPPIAQHVQDKVDNLRRNQQEQEKKKEEEAEKKLGIRSRVAKASVDLFLVDLVRRQAKTHQAAPKTPPREATPSPPQTPESAGAEGTATDSGLAGSSNWAEESANPEDFQVHANKHDMTFSPGKNSKQSTPNKENNSISSQQKEEDTVPKVVIESLPAEGHPGGLNSGSDLTAFQARIEAAIDDFNEKLEDDATPIRNLPPDWDRQKFYIIPADDEAGDNIIALINKSVRLPGHPKIRASWNHQLFRTATVSLRYKSVAAKRDHRLLIEDPKKGIARLNGWKLEGREIVFCHGKPDPKDSAVHFVTIQVSERICGLIQEQQGKLWISGGTATAEWNNKDLTKDTKVNFSLQ